MQLSIYPNFSVTLQSNKMSQRLQNIELAYFIRSTPNAICFERPVQVVFHVVALCTEDVPVSPPCVSQHWKVAIELHFSSLQHSHKTNSKKKIIRIRGVSRWEAIGPWPPTKGRQDSIIISIEQYAKLWHGPPF